MKTFTENEMLAYLEGRLGADDAREFEDCLRKDPEVRKALLVLGSLEAELPEALSEVADEEPVQDVLEKRSVPHRIMRILVPLAAAAGLVLAVRLMLPPAVPVSGTVTVAQRPAEGRLGEARGDVNVTGADGRSITVGSVKGTAIYSGDTIVLGPAASVRLVLVDGSELTLYKSTVVIFNQTEKGPVFDVHQGALDAVIQPQPEGRRLVVNTKFLRADIIGTEFRAMADSRSAWLGVRKGSVKVTREADGKKVELQDGNYAAVAPNWPYMRMNARVCPVWKSVCQQAVGTAYP